MQHIKKVIALSKDFTHKHLDKDFANAFSILLSDKALRFIDENAGDLLRGQSYKWINYYCKKISEVNKSARLELRLDDSDELKAIKTRINLKLQGSEDEN